MVNIDHVSLLEVIAAARGRYASLVPESAGHLMLGISRATAKLPVRIHASEVLLNTEGAISLVGRKQAQPMLQATQQLSLLLDGLLGVTTRHMPAMANAAQRARDCEEVERLYAIVTQALIPLNRGAAKRALARLARETIRAKEQGLLELEAVYAQLEAPRTEAPAPKPPAPPVAKPDAPSAARAAEALQDDPEIIVLDEEEIMMLGDELTDDELAQAALAAVDPPAAERPKSVPPPLKAASSPELVSTPLSREATPGTHEPTPTVVDAEVDARHSELDHMAPVEAPRAPNAEPQPQAEPQPAIQSLASAPEAKPATTTAAHAPAPLNEPHDEAPGPASPEPSSVPKERASNLRSDEESSEENLAELCAPDPIQQDDRVQDPIALPTSKEPSRLDLLLDNFGDSDDDGSVGSAASSLKRLAQLDPTPPPTNVYALTPSMPRCEELSDPSMRISGFPHDADDDSGAIAPQTILSQRLMASRAPLAVGAAVLTVLLVLGALLFSTDEPSPAANANSPLPATAPSKVAGCHADLALRDLPSPHEILLKLGTAPFESVAIPTGVRLELVAMAPGHAAERIVIPHDADWQPVDGKRVMPLRLALRPGDGQRWPSAPAARLGGMGPRGYLSVTSLAANTDLWLVAGAGNGSRNTVSVRCDDAAELLVINPARPAKRKRIRLEAPLLRAASKTKSDPIPVMP